MSLCFIFVAWRLNSGYNGSTVTLVQWCEWFRSDHSEYLCTGKHCPLLCMSSVLDPTWSTVDISVYLFTLCGRSELLYEFWWEWCLEALSIIDCFCIGVMLSLHAFIYHQRFALLSYFCMWISSPSSISWDMSPLMNKNIKNLSQFMMSWNNIKSLCISMWFTVSLIINICIHCHSCLRASHCTDYHVTSLLFLHVTCPCSLRTYVTLKFIRSSSSSSSCCVCLRLCMYVFVCLSVANPAGGVLPVQ